MGIREILSGALKSMMTMGGETVTYRRGSNSVQVKALPGREESPVIPDPNFPTDLNPKVWVFKPGDLVLNSQAITPRPGDVIEITVSGVTKRYEVLEDPGAQQVSEQTGYGTGIRVRSKLIP